MHFLDEMRAADAAVMRAALVHPDTMVASDAMPLSGLGPGAERAWPLPASAITHPRTAGTFARCYRRLVAEGGGLSLAEFIRRASVLPAGVVATAAGGAARKGTLAGADADVVVFDPQTFRDRATYETSTQPSSGVRHLLVSGEPLIQDGRLIFHARPGRPVRRS